MVLSVVLSTEDVSGVFVKRLDPAGFLGQEGLIVDIKLAPSLGIAEIGPVRCLVAGSVESRPFDKGFQQDRTNAVASFPVVCEPPGGHAEDAGCQVFAADPGQDEETRVVDHQVEGSAALVGVPADEAVAGLDGPGGGAKAEQSDDALFGPDEVAQLGGW